MYLDVVSPELVESDEPISSISDAHAVFDNWRNWSPSLISHHGKACCETTREWINATDFSLLNGGNLITGPRWLRERFPWGPSAYPIFWCEILRRKRLDCGVHAALAHEVFISRGIKCFRAQLVQEFSPAAAAQWHSSWNEQEITSEWIRDDLIYHEGCAVVPRRNSIKIWDSSAGWWVEPNTTSGYGSLLAVKISSFDAVKELRWGRHVIDANRWSSLHNLDHDANGFTTNESSQHALPAEMAQVELPDRESEHA